MAVSFKTSMTAYAVGRRANMEEWNTITRSLEGATALDFGVPAIAGSGDHGCLPLTATAQNVLGITEASLILPHTTDTYQQYDGVAICEKGVIGVLLDDDVVKGAQARFNLATKKWTDAAQSATVITIPGAQFDAAGVTGAVGIIRYRRPVPSLSVGS